MERQTIGPLACRAYGLRRRASYGVRDGNPVLFLDFPLKIIRLNPVWKPLFDRISAERPLPLREATDLVPGVAEGKIERFLDDLVRKGFLEPFGFSALPVYPSVSIIIPVRNRAGEVAHCLRSLDRLDYPSEKMEVIVVDDASSDQTPDAVSRFPVNLIRLNDRKQASFCRNLAAMQAKGEILAFLDSDCVADPLWLKELVPAFGDPLVGAVGGLVDAFFEEKGLDHYEKVKSSLMMGHWYRRSGKEDRFFYVPSCNFLVRRERFASLGGFKVGLQVGEDVDLCWRLQDLGYEIEYRPIGRIYHKHRNRVGPFCRRRFDYGTSEPLLQQMHPERIKRLLLPPGACAFWGITVLSLVSVRLPVLALSGLVLLVETLGRLRRIGGVYREIGFHRVFIALLRSDFAFLYHCCGFLSRYYLMWSPVIWPFCPAVSLTLMGSHLFAGLVEFFIKKPRLGLFAFLVFFSLEQLSYQCGVWWGCVKRFYFRPINPFVIFRSAARDSR